MNNDYIPSTSRETGIRFRLRKQPLLLQDSRNYSLKDGEGRGLERVEFNKTALCAALSVQFVAIYLRIAKTSLAFFLIEATPAFFDLLAKSK